MASQAVLELLLELKDNASSGLASVTGALGTMGTVLTGIAVGGFVALGAAIVGGIGDAREAAGLFASTEQTILSMGNAAGVSAQHVVDMASSLSDAAGKSLFGDDQIQQASNLLLTFGEIKGATLDAATALTVDLAQALGGDPQAQAMMLGKALNDPIKGITALGKAGLTFSDEQKEVIRTMVESGNIAGAQGIIIDELNKQVGGQAAAAAAAAGGWVQFKARMGEAAETIGGLFLPAIDAVGAFLVGTVAPAIENIVNAVSDVITTFQEAGTGSLQFALAIMNLGTALGIPGGLLLGLVSGFQSFLASLQPVATFIQANLQPILFGIGVVIAAAVVPALISAGIAAVGAVASFALLLAPLIAIGAAAALLYAAFQNNFMGLADIIQPVIDAVVNGFGEGGIIGAISGLITSLQTAGPQIGQWLLSVASLIAQNVLTWGQALISWVAPYVSLALTALAGFATSIGTWIVQQAPLWGAQLLSWGNAFVNWITPYISLALTALSGFITSLWAWVQQQAPGWVAQLLAWAQAFLSWIGPMIPPVLAALGNLIVSIGGWIVTQVPILISKFLAWGQSFVSWIAPMIPPALAALGGLATSLFNWIGQQVAPLLAKFSEWAGALVAWIVPATVKFLGEWPGMLNSFLNWIGGAVGPLLVKLATWAGAFIGWIVPMIPGFITAVAGIAAALLIWIGQTVGVLAGKLLEWGLAFISWIGPKIPGILAAVGEIALSILAWIGETVPKIVSRLIEWGTAFINWIGPKIPGILAAVGEVAVKILAWIGEQVGALAGKLVEWGTAFVGWVGAEVLPKIPGALAEILTKIGDWIGGAVTWVGGELAKVGAAVVSGIKDGISKAWDGFTGWIDDQVAKIPQAIRDFFQMGSPSRLMADQVGLPIVQGIMMGVESGMGGMITTMGKVAGDITASARGAITGVASAFRDNSLPEAAAAAGRDIIAGWMGGMRENFSGVTEAAAGMGEAVVASLKGTFEIGSPSQLMSREIGIPIVDGITAGINIASPKLSERMLQLGTMLVDLVSKGVDAFGKLRSLGTISMSSITQFANTLQSAMTAFGEMTLRWDKAMMSAASQFTRKSGDVIDLMSKGVEMLSKLKDFEAVPADVFRSFSTALEAAILEIVRISTFANRQLLTNAQSFSEGAIKVIAVVGVGVDALNKLGTLAAPTQGAFLNFSTQVSFLVFRMGQAGAAMSVDIVAAAAQFSEGAGKVLGLLGTGVEGLMKLSDLTAPVPGVFLRFSEMVGDLVLRMGQVASQFSADAVKSASVFAEGAGKVISIIGGGVDAFTKLDTFRGVGPNAILYFFGGLANVVTQIAMLAGQFQKEAVAAAAIFAEGVGKIIAILSGGVEAFTKLDSFVGVGPNAILYFAGGLANVLTAITQLSTQWAQEAIASAAAFAEGAGKVIGIIGGGVDAFIKLNEFTGGRPQRHFILLGWASERPNRHHTAFDPMDSRSDSRGCGLFRGSWKSRRYHRHRRRWVPETGGLHRRPSKGCGCVWLCPAHDRRSHATGGFPIYR